MGIMENKMETTIVYLNETTDERSGSAEGFRSYGVHMWKSAAQAASISCREQPRNFKPNP